MSDWQPISTAPRDCTRILVSIPPGYVTVGYWRTESHMARPRPFWGHELQRGKAAQRRMQPTHWMPLPVPAREATP